MVPPDTVLTEINNPTGDAIVWYAIYDNQPYIRCFVPGGGA
jgi:hypothetical protein